MEALSSKFSNRSILKIGLSLLLTTAFSYASYANCKEGLSPGRQAKLIESLQNYEPLSANVSSAQQTLKTSDADVQRRNEYCDQEEYPQDKYCLERRYMKDGFYIVRITFDRDPETPVQPSAPYILGSKPLQRDTARRDAFLIEQQEEIVQEYLGSYYQSFHSVELVMSKSKVVVINVAVSEATELTSVLADPRVARVKHIGNPSLPLEESTP